MPLESITSNIAFSCSYVFGTSSNNNIGGNPNYGSITIDQSSQETIGLNPVGILNSNN